MSIADLEILSLFFAIFYHLFHCNLDFSFYGAGAYSGVIPGLTFYTLNVSLHTW